MIDSIRRVLVVEDDEIIREMLELALINAGYNVATAEHGRRALDLLPASRPDVIVLDLRMPVMDGYQFRAEQRRRGGYVDRPVVVLSASRDTEGVGEQLAAAAVVAKPFDLGELLATIDRLAGARGGRPLVVSSGATTQF
jgi:two-component system, chemotaxis family, chemotaxis protein CheY